MNFQRTFIAFVAIVALAGCAQPASTPSLGASTTDPAPAAGESKSPALESSAPSKTVVSEVYVSCNVDADCTVKNVGNCCGYYPACVHKDSPTFPELVAKRCAEEGMVGICGFPEIRGCACVEGRCAPADAATK